MWLLALALAALGYLSWEQARLRRAQQAVPLRVAVTGTRGKSTVVRLLASVLRESGRQVLAKTTGSEASLVLPDGGVERIRRRGAASILEQKACLRRARQTGAECLVAELMSIHAENHVVESQMLIRPQVVVITNVGLDHLDAMGDTREDIASVLAECITPLSDVFVPEAELASPLVAMARRRGATIHTVRSEPAALGHTGVPPGLHFAQNLHLAAAVAEYLGAGREAIDRGLARAKLDVGRLAVWRYPRRGRDDTAEPSGRIFVVMLEKARTQRKAGVKDPSYDRTIRVCETICELTAQSARDVQARAAVPLAFTGVLGGLLSAFVFADRQKGNEVPLSKIFFGGCMVLSAYVLLSVKAPSPPSNLIQADVLERQIKND